MKPGALSDYLRTGGIRHALIGAVAVAARGYTRSTLDVDFLVTDTAVLRDAFWEQLRSTGAEVEIRKGDFDDPLRGVVRIRAGDDDMADVVVAKYRWQDAILDRTEMMQIEGTTVPVPSTGDLILLKLFAGGPLDMIDVRSLLNSPDRERIIGEVREHLPELPNSCRSEFEAIVSVGKA